MLKEAPDTIGIGERASHPRSKYNKIVRSIAAFTLLAGSALGLTRDEPLPNTYTVNHESKPFADDYLFITTANMHSWISPEGSSNLQQFKRVIEEQGSGFICVQEAKDGPEIQELVADYNVVFTTTKKDRLGRRFGNLILSDAPIEFEQEIELPHPETDEPRKAIVARIQTKFGEISVANVHLSINYSEALLQARYFEQHLENPVDIVCGDFNLENPINHSISFGRSTSFGTFQQYSPLSSDHQPTFSSLNPERQIDWILSPCFSFPDTLEVSRTTQRLDTDSDHLALQVRVRLRDLSRSAHSHC